MSMYVLFPKHINNDKAKKIMKDIAKLLDTKIIVDSFKYHEIHYFDKYFIDDDEYTNINELIYYTIINNTVSVEAVFNDSPYSSFPHSYNYKNPIISKYQRPKLYIQCNDVFEPSKKTLKHRKFLKNYNEIDEVYVNVETETKYLRNLKLKKDEYIKYDITNLMKYLSKYSSKLRKIKLNHTDFFELFEHNLKYINNFEFIKSFHKNNFSTAKPIFDIYTILLHIMIRYSIKSKDEFHKLKPERCWSFIKLVLYTESGCIITQVETNDIIKYILENHPEISDYLIHLN